MVTASAFSLNLVDLDGCGVDPLFAVDGVLLDPSGDTCEGPGAEEALASMGI